MKIDAMVIREDFYWINEKTLEDYYKNILKNEISVTTKTPSVFNKIFVYPKINTITSQFPSRKVIKYVFSEFNVRNNLVKNILGKTYTAMCLFSGGLMASKTLSFDKVKSFDRNILIWPCNRKIRIFDFKNNIVDSIIKDGFTDKYFKRELSFRLNSNYSFVPKIIKSGNNWYREPILKGQPLARISNVKQFNQSCTDAISCMKEIIENSIEYVDAIEYTQNLYYKIERLIIQAENEKNIITGAVLLKTALTASIKGKSLKTKVPVAESHGDLQAGNIWVDNNKKTYLIDWETHDKRSVWYDSVTLLLATRRHNGIYNMVENRNNVNVKKAIFSNDNTERNDNIDAIMGILVLEDIIFYLEDNLELPENWGGDLIDRYGMQLEKLKW